jgi:predicted nucleic acid-binding protein
MIPMKDFSVAMTFEDIPAGSAVFVDANTFVYAFDPDPTLGPACEQLLQRIENGQLQGFRSSQVVAEMAHRLMTLEAARLLKRSLTGMANWLKRHPAEIPRLARYRQGLDELTLIGVQVIPVTGQALSLAADISRQFGLLTNDAVVVTIMQANGLTLLASHDADFNRVPGITRYAPV